MINNETYKVGVYLRLSCEDAKQKESSSITNQRDIINQYLTNHNLLCISEYVDDGVSGTTFDREGFNQMIKDIESHKINMVITKDLSRFGRNEGQQLRYLDYFYEKNIRYVAILDNVDTADESNMSNEMIPIQCFFNEKHVRDTSKKMRASVYNKRQQGLFLGKTAPYGYIKNPHNKYQLLIDSESSQVVQRIYSLFINGKSISEISRILSFEKIPIPSEYKKLKVGRKSTAYGIWDNRTISDILTLPTYAGNLTQGRAKKISYKSKKVIRTKKEDWIICEGKCPAIISNETFDMAQNIYQHNKNKHKHSQDLLLKGLVYCKECGHTIGFRLQKIKTKSKGEILKGYGNCNYWNKHKLYNVCTPHSIKYDELEQIVINDIQTICRKHLDFNVLKSVFEKNNPTQKVLNDLESKAITLSMNLKNSSQKLEDLYNDKLENIIDIDMYQKMAQRISSETLSQKQALKDINNQIYNIKEKLKQNIIDDTLINDYLHLEKPSVQLVTSLIKRIDIDEEKNISIFYKFRCP